MPFLAFPATVCFSLCCCCAGLLDYAQAIMAIMVFGNYFKLILNIICKMQLRIVDCAAVCDCRWKAVPRITALRWPLFSSGNCDYLTVCLSARLKYFVMLNAADRSYIIWTGLDLQSQLPSNIEQLAIKRCTKSTSFFVTSVWLTLLTFSASCQSNQFALCQWLRYKYI